VTHYVEHISILPELKEQLSHFPKIAIHRKAHLEYELVDSQFRKQGGWVDCRFDSILLQDFRLHHNRLVFGLLNIYIGIATHYRNSLESKIGGETGPPMQCLHLRDRQ